MIGSPPQAWGQLSRQGEFRTCYRLTPTGVGTTLLSGESTLPQRGSPPQAWGQRRDCKRSSPQISGSPPQAWGQPAGTIAKSARDAAHPHRRGDNLSNLEVPIWNNGSPPQAWGQLFWWMSVLALNTAHPHRRGDNRSGQR